MTGLGRSTFSPWLYDYDKTDWSLLYKATFPADENGVAAVIWRDWFFDAPAGGGSDVTGSASQTLGGVTQSASGRVRIAGTAAQSLGAVTQSAAGALRIAGTVSQTLGTVTQTASAALRIAGAASQTLAAVTQAATGELVSTGIGGTTSQTLGGVAQSARAVMIRIYRTRSRRGYRRRGRR